MITINPNRRIINNNHKCYIKFTNQDKLIKNKTYRHRPRFTRRNNNNNNNNNNNTIRTTLIIMVKAIKIVNVDIRRNLGIGIPTKTEELIIEITTKEIVEVEIAVANLTLINNMKKRNQITKIQFTTRLINIVLVKTVLIL